MTPDLTFQGKLIIIDLPTLSYGRNGQIVQTVWKYLFQKVVQGRRYNAQETPIFIWLDECQQLVTETDRDFMNIARSYGVASVYLTQSILNLNHTLGEPSAKALLGAFQTYFFHANTDQLTKQWASERIGKPKQGDWGLSHNDQNQGNYSYSEKRQYLVDLYDYQKLQTGGPENQYEVEAFLHRQGQRFKETNHHHRKVVFGQY